MIEYFLGIITGILVAGFLLIVGLYSRPSIQHLANQIISRVKEKGKILEEAPEELQQWIESLNEVPKV